jgi:hypothetical protein
MAEIKDGCLKVKYTCLVAVVIDSVRVL